MVELIKVDEVPKHEGEEVKVRGWVYRQRAGKKMAFILLRDSSGVVQCTFKEGSPGFEKASSISIESSCIIKGVVSKDERAPSGFEIKASSLEVVHLAERFPITKDQSDEFLLDMRHLWLRSQKMTAVLKIRSTVFRAIDDFFRSRGYYEFQSPLFTPAAAEGGSTLFEVNYFGKKTYLTQTWQLYAEAAIYSLEKIYTIAPSFRAEKSSTSRHLTEYWHAEMEAAWMDFKELQVEAEELVSYICKRVADERSKELKELGRSPEELRKVTAPFPRITYEKALEKLKQEGMQVPYGKDLRTIEEKKLTELYDKPLIVTHYPKEIKAFYMKEAPEDKSKVLGFDMLVKGVGEIIGGSEREEDIKILEQKLKEEGEDLDKYKFYLDTRRYGSVPHSGFGMGVERVVMWICGLSTIKDAISFPRTPERDYP